MDFRSNYYRKSFKTYPRTLTKTSKKSVEEERVQDDESEIVVEEHILNEDDDEDEDFQDEEISEELEIDNISENYLIYNNINSYNNNNEVYDYNNDNNDNNTEVNFHNNIDNQLQDELMEFCNGELTPEVPPPTSGSLDCSSIGSIPWADDAINRNKQKWENVEQMLNDLEPLPNDEELSKEISDWQQKFPQIFRKYTDHHFKSSQSSPLENTRRVLSSRRQPDNAYRKDIYNKNVEQISARLERQSLKDLPWKVDNSIDNIAEMSDHQLTEFLKQIGILTVPRNSQYQSVRPVIKSYRSFQDDKGITLKNPLYKAFSPPRTASPLSRASLAKKCPRMPPIISEISNITTAPPHTQRKQRSFVLLGQVQQTAFNNPRDYQPTSKHLSLFQHHQYNSFVLPAIAHKRQQEPQENLISLHSSCGKQENFHMRKIKLREPIHSSSGSSSISSESQRSSIINNQYQRKQRLEPPAITNSVLTYRDIPLKLNINK